MFSTGIEMENWPNMDWKSDLVELEENVKISHSLQKCKKKVFH